MADFELVMPKMGESILEATILKWLKQEGDQIEEDETILEIATDKVDSEVPSPVDGVISKILHPEGAAVAVGETIALIQTGSVAAIPAATIEEYVDEPMMAEEAFEPGQAAPSEKDDADTTVIVHTNGNGKNGDRFLSPLVRNIAKNENISAEELTTIEGTGLHGKITKKDVMNYLTTRSQSASSDIQPVKTAASVPHSPATTTSEVSAKTKAEPVRPKPTTTSVSASGTDQIVEMDRMRKLIAQHMIKSKEVAAHVTSFVEADMTNIWDWRQRNKKQFQEKHEQKLSFMPMIIEAVIKAIQQFPNINVSLQGENIVYKKDINIGMATALPSGNLIVPVIHNANHLNLLGLAERVNTLAHKARSNKLDPQDIQGGTFTISNLGTFGNIMGTPIINQPEVAILAIGAIRKVPAVVETEHGDLIAVRKKMFLSLSYDHRIVDGMLGGSFLKQISDNLEAFDHNQTV